MLVIFRIAVEWMTIVLPEWYHRGSRGRGLDTVKNVLASQSIITDRSKAALPQFTCCVCVYMVFGGVVGWMTVAHYAFFAIKKGNR